MNESTECNQALPEVLSRTIHPAQQALAENKADPALERHTRKCSICCHPDREEMEQEYIEWSRPSSIAKYYEAPERVLYRDFEAVGLVSRRRANLTAVLENMIERGPGAPLTGDTIIRAVKAICCLNSDTKWTEPAKNVVHTMQTEPKSATAIASATATSQALPLPGEVFHDSKVTGYESPS